MLWVQRERLILGEKVRAKPPGIFSHEAPMVPRGPRFALFATIPVRTFSLCLIMPNWEKNCLANRLASPPLRCPSNPALRGDTERRRSAASATAGSAKEGRVPPRRPQTGGSRAPAPLSAAPACAHSPSPPAQTHAHPLRRGHPLRPSLKRHLSLSGKQKVSQK